MKTLLNVLYWDLLITYGKRNNVYSITLQMEYIIYIYIYIYIYYVDDYGKICFLFLVSGLQCYKCVPKEKEPNRVLNCMTAHSDVGKVVKCEDSPDADACMLTYTGILLIALW